MKPSKVVFGILGLIVFVGILFVAQGVLSSSSEPTSDDEQTAENQETDYRKLVKDNYNVFAIELPEEISFAGEPIPIENTDVKERLDREFLVNTYWHSQTFLFHKRANRWFPIIEPILKKNNVPDDFKYLCVIESGLDNVKSPAGASGFWQFMKSTGQGYDLEISEDVDERYHLEKATEAACKYLIEAKSQLGTWALAAASYNMGKGGVTRRLNEQKVTSYYDLHLNSETSRYMMRMIALKYIMSESEYYGFRLREQDLYKPYQISYVKVDTTLASLIDFATQNGTTYRTLKILNPWLRSKKLTVAPGNSYNLALPKTGFPISGEIRAENE